MRVSFNAVELTSFKPGGVTFRRERAESPAVARARFDCGRGAAHRPRREHSMCSRAGHKPGFSRNSASVSAPPLRIQRISVTPWGGLKLSGITIPQKLSPAFPSDFLRGQSFRLADSVFVPVRRAARHQGNFVDQLPRLSGRRTAMGNGVPSMPAGARGTASFRRNPRRPRFPGPPSQSAEQKALVVQEPPAKPGPAASSSGRENKPAPFTPGSSARQRRRRALPFLDEKLRPAKRGDTLRTSIFGRAFRTATDLRGNITIAKHVAPRPVLPSSSARNRRCTTTPA